MNKTFLAIERVLSSRLSAYLIVLFFIVLKLPHLNLPFFWDESWPYASAIHKMYQLGPSLMPDAIPSELSRGHPTLFIYSVSIWMKLFGTSLTAIHSFPLTVAVLFCISLYEVGRKLFSRTAGFICLLIVPFQLIFFVQSSMVLLEISLAFAGFLCVYFYAFNRLWALTFALLALFFMKESGAVLGLSLGIVSVLRLCMKEINAREFKKHLLVFSVPVVAYLVFFMLQKKLLGWYLFPVHTELIDPSIKAIFKKIRAALTLIFLDGNRWLLSTGVLVLLLCLLYAKRQSLKAILSINVWKQHIAGKWSPKQIFVIATLMFTPLFLIFSGVNVFINRYFIIVFVLVWFLLSAIIDCAISSINAALVLPTVIILGAFHFYNFQNSKNISDVDLTAFDVMNVEQKMVKYLEEKYGHQVAISSNAFLLRTQLTDVNTRYLSSNAVFTNVNWEVNDQTQLFIYSNKEYDYQYEAVKANTAFRLAKRISVGRAYAEIYERK